MNILLLECGRPPDEVEAHFGGFGRWFRDAAPAHAMTVVTAYGPGALALDPARFDRVIASGSLSSVNDRLPWMREVGRYLLHAAQLRVPVLGVCFGHQLLATAIGGEVRAHPRGWQMGTVECQLTAAGVADPLFRGLPDRMLLHAVHEEAVVALPPSATVLASSPLTPVQAFRAGPWLQGVQCHPELSAAALAVWVAAIHPGLSSRIRPTTHGLRLLENFIRGTPLLGGASTGQEAR